MANLISAHLLAGECDFGVLSQLPASCGYTVYFHEGIGRYLLDVYSSRKRPRGPFWSLVPAVDLPLELPPELGVLNEFHDLLARQKRANGFKRSYVSCALLLSQLLGTEVLSLVTDDDQLDFACRARGGAVTRLHFRCEDLQATYTPDGFWIEPMFSEDEPDDDEGELLTDLAELRAAIPSAMVADRTWPMPTQLHELAMREVAAFTGEARPILGLGSFDPPEDEAQWRKIAQR
jgi:hypothetical protein